MILALPLPPSVNAMYRHHGHVTYKTVEAKRWISECKKLVSVKQPLTGQISLTVDLYLFRERDIDNSLKALLDLLQELRIVENDKQIVRLVVNKMFDKKLPRVIVCVEENSVAILGNRCIV